MQRALITVAIVVALIAVIGIATVLYMRPVRRDGETESAAQSRHVDRAAGELSATSGQVAKGLAEAEPAAEAAGTVTGKSDGHRTGSPTSVGDVRTPLASPLSRLASQMTPQQRQAVIKARWTRMRREVKYRLPSTYKLHRLSRAADADLRLTDDQKEKIAQLNEAMKPKIDQALKDVWARRQKVLEDLRAAIDDHNEGDIKANRALYTRVFGQENRIRQDVLDKQFRDMLQDVLTTEQMEILTDGFNNPQHIRKLYGRRPSTTDSVQYQNTKE